jgi:hypothetical protein
MSKRVSQTILLCEDAAQERLTKAYMQRCRLPTGPPDVISLVASRMMHGGNDHWVLTQFPKQLHACRQRKKRSKTLLIVLLDADEKHTVEGRRRQLLATVTAAGYEDFGSEEPAVLLFPKRNIETWIPALLEQTVNEEDDYKTRDKSTKEDFRKAAETLYQWSRLNAVPGSTCVSSLLTSLPEWRKIG